MTPPPRRALLTLAYLTLASLAVAAPAPGWGFWYFYLSLALTAMVHLLAAHPPHRPTRPPRRPRRCRWGLDNYPQPCRARVYPGDAAHARYMIGGEVHSVLDRLHHGAITREVAYAELAAAGRDYSDHTGDVHRYRAHAIQVADHADTWPPPATTAPRQGGWHAVRTGPPPTPAAPPPVALADLWQALNNLITPTPLAPILTAERWLAEKDRLQQAIAAHPDNPKRSTP